MAKSVYQRLKNQQKKANEIQENVLNWFSNLDAIQKAILLMNLGKAIDAGANPTELYYTMYDPKDVQSGKYKSKEGA